MFKTRYLLKLLLFFFVIYKLRLFKKLSTYSKLKKYFDRAVLCFHLYSYVHKKKKK